MTNVDRQDLVTRSAALTWRRLVTVGIAGVLCFVGGFVGSGIVGPGDEHQQSLLALMGVGFALILATWALVHREVREGPLIQVQDRARAYLGWSRAEAVADALGLTRRQLTIGIVLRTLVVAMCLAGVLVLLI